MNEKEREAWNSRPVTVTVLTRCDECEALKPDVEKRTRMFGWTPYVVTCCGACFNSLIVAS